MQADNGEWTTPDGSNALSMVALKKKMVDISEEDLVRIQEKIEKLKQSKFKQQMLPAWRPVPSFGSTMIIFGIFGLIFLTLGITLYVMSERIQGVVM